MPQHPDEVVHAPPALLQQRLVPTTSAHERPPVQQPGALPPGVHAAASAREQVAAIALHTPD